VLTFPTHLFNPMRVALRPLKSVVMGGESLSGVTDVIRTDGGGSWAVQMAGIELITPDLIRAWRAWEDTLEGGVTRVLVPVADVRQAPRPIVGGKLSSPSQLASESEDPYFPEAVGFATPWIVAATVGAALLRATQLTINVARGTRLKGGEIFDIDHPTLGRRVYRVGRVLARAGQQATVQIRPPLREATPDATALNFDWPVLTATLVPEADISPELTNGRHGTVDIVSREAF
jgi:hypothetical protein